MTKDRFDDSPFQPGDTVRVRKRPYMAGFPQDHARNWRGFNGTVQPGSFKTMTTVKIGNDYHTFFNSDLEKVL